MLTGYAFTNAGGVLSGRSPVPEAGQRRAGKRRSHRL